MSEFERSKDYYEILGADEGASAVDLERRYKKMAARLHPDKGGNEEAMKLLNEAYGVLKNRDTRRDYDAQRAKPTTQHTMPVSTPAAKDVGLLGHGLSAFLCLMAGAFLLVLVRAQWIWFLWPLVILAIFVIGLGIVMARGAMRAFNSSLPVSNPVRRHTRIQEAAFWTVVLGSGYGIYLLLTNL
jgi:hypothetical protein